MALNKLNTIGGLNTLNTLGSSSSDLSVEELVMIANASGGALSQRAMELTHPNRSILSTIGNGFKGAFKGFIDVISTPSEIVAGMISPDYTIKEAIKENKRVSDAIFGDKQIFGGDEPTTLQKIGNFAVRLPIDILTDPLTYLTFGGQAGILGLKSLAKIDIGVNTINKLGKAGKATKQGGVASAYLTKEGSELTGYLRNVQRQASGEIPLNKFNKSIELQRGELLKKGIIKETELDLAENELKQLLKLTTESPLDMDWAKRAVSNMLEKAPALLPTILDKGGIKFLGKTILSSQRISSVGKVIPLMSKLDDITLPLRQSIMAKFDPALQPMGGGAYMRMPDEAIQFQTQMRNLEARQGIETITNLQNIQRELKLTKDEWNKVYDAVWDSKPIYDPRLNKAYLAAKGINDKNAKLIESINGTYGDLSNHIGSMFVPTDTRHLGASKFAKELGQSKQATIARFIKQESENFKAQLPEIKKILGVKEEAGSAVARETTKSIKVEGGVGKMHGLNPNKWGDYNHEFLKAKEFKGDGAFQDIGLEINGVQKLTPEGVIDVYKKYGAEVVESKFFPKTVDGEATLAIKLKKPVSDEVMVKISSELEQEAIPQFIRGGEEVLDNLGIATGAKSVQEVGWKIGEQITKLSDQLIASGKSMDEVLADKQVKELFDMREKIGGLAQDAERTGIAEDLGLTPLKGDDGLWTITDDSGATYKRAQAHAKELRLAGYDNIDTNLMTIMAHQSLKNQRQALGQHFMEGLVRMFAKQADEAPEGWRTIDNGALEAVAERVGRPLQTKDGIDLVFHPAIAKHYEDMVSTLGKDVEMGKFLKSFDALQRYWKTSVTSIFPMFHGRNAISGVLQNYLDLGFETFNPKTNIIAMNIAWNDMQANKLARKAMGSGDDAAKALKEYNTLLDKKIFTDASGYNWTFGEIRNAIKDNGVALNKNIIGAMDVTVDRDKMLSSVFGVGKTKLSKVKDAVNPFDIDTNLLTRGGRNVAYTIENQLRITNFVANLNNTGDVMHAAARSKLFQFDYGNLTKFERDVMRRLIPFYTFTRKNLELQAKILMSNPGRISHELTAIRGIGEVMGGEELSDEEKKLLPAWMANTIAFKRKGKDGKDEIISGFGTPIEQPFQAFQPTSLLGSVSPLFRYPVEVISGYQFFKGKPTSEIINAQNFDKAPDAIKDFIGYGKYEGTAKDGKKYSVSYSLRPGNMHMINNLPFLGRVGNVLGQMTNATVSNQLKLLQGITGVNVRSYNFDQLERNQEEQLKSSIEKIMRDAGIGGEFKRFYLKKNIQQVGE